jgi:hypothetical protein
MSTTIVRFARQPRRCGGPRRVDGTAVSCAAQRVSPRAGLRLELSPAVVQAALAHADTRVRDWLALALGAHTFES